MNKNLPQKILFVIPALNMGGAEMQVIFQANELAKHNIPVQLLVLTDTMYLQDRLHSDVSIFNLPGSELKTVNKKMFLAFYRYRSRIISLINQFEPTDIIASLAPSHYVIREVANSLKNNPKLWIYHHSTQFLQNPNDNVAKKLFHRWNRWRSQNRDSGHLYVSKAVKNDIECNYGCTGSLLYNALPHQKIETSLVESLLQKYSLPKNEYVIIPGRLHLVKGHQFFLESIYQFIKRQNIRVVFAGYGPTKSSLEKTIQQLNLESNVMITGKIPNKELLALMKGAKFVVTPSIHEGLGNVAIEALMMGKTILSSNAGGLPEVVFDGENGYLFEKGNKFDFMLAFTRLWNDFEELQFPEGNQISYFMDKFTIGSQVKRLISILNSEKVLSVL